LAWRVHDELLFVFHVVGSFWRGRSRLDVAIERTQIPCLAR
jgi:hypothetical protein